MGFCDVIAHQYFDLDVEQMLLLPFPLVSPSQRRYHLAFLSCECIDMALVEV